MQLAQAAKEKMHAPVFSLAASAAVATATKSEGTNPIPLSDAATRFFKTNPTSGLSQNSHLGHQLPTAVLYQGLGPAISNTATGLEAPLCDFRVRPRCTGKERDAESGLDFFESRYMSSAQGRFTSPDKFPWWNLQHSEKEEEKKQFADYIGNPQNWNMYTYVLNNPLNHTDPTGMLGCQVGNQKYTTCTITVVYDPKTSKGTLTVTGQNKGDENATVLLSTGVVVGGDGHLTPTGTFTASVWEKDHVSKLYGTAADTPWSKTVLGGNAFGPYQLHIKELDSRGIFIHGTMGPGWSPTTWGNSIFLSPASHGCVRMCNSDNINLHKIMPDPSGNKIIIGTTPEN
jgi:RHS repeat-associated protein